MNDKSLNDFDSICWQLSKDYFNAMNKSHIIRMIEHASNKQIEQNNELDSEEHQRVG